MVKIPQLIYKTVGWLAFALMLTGILFLSSNSTNAQASGQALEISPPVLTLTADPGETVKTRVLIRNVSRTDLVVSGEANDFVAAGEDGTPKVLLEETEKSPYSMKEWIFTPTQLTLVPREIKTMNITIKVPSDASPGGHYGVIRFTGTPPNLEGQGVSLSASLGSLILLSVNGDVTEHLAIDEFSINKSGKSGKIFNSLPLNFVERIKNDGNVHERPGGSIVITNMFNKNVATFSYNPAARYILPGSTRKFEQPVDKTLVANKRLFGKYTAKLTVAYGEGENKTETSTVTFWIIPYKLVTAILILLVGGFFIFRFIIRRYNRYIVRRSNRH